VFRYRSVWVDELLTNVSGVYVCLSAEIVWVSLDTIIDWVWLILSDLMMRIVCVSALLNAGRFEVNWSVCELVSMVGEGFLVGMLLFTFTTSLTWFVLFVTMVVVGAWLLRLVCVLFWSHALYILSLVWGWVVQSCVLWWPTHPLHFGGAWQWPAVWLAPWQFEHLGGFLFHLNISSVLRRCRSLL
jgi:hypothetical protein